MLAIPCVALAIDPSLVPDPLYEPKVGDLCSIGAFDAKSKSCYDVDASKDYNAYYAYSKALQSDDDATLDRLAAEGDTVELEAGTRVELLRVVDYPPRDPRPEAAYIRPDEGPYRDRYFWIARDELLRKVGVAKVPAVVNPRLTAKALLKWGRYLEGRGNETGALGFYRRLIQEYPGAPEAKTAAARIQALGQ